MSKNKLIKTVYEILESWGFTHDHFVMSLQGPTMILSLAGQEKITTKQRWDLEKMGIAILG